AFVAKLLPVPGGGLAYSSFLGGGADDSGNAIAVDPAGNAYVAGSTSSAAPSAFPTTMGAHQTTRGGSQDALLAKVRADRTTKLASAYLGGNGFDAATGLAVDLGGNAFVTGATTGVGPLNTFPTTGGAYQNAWGGGQDAFVTKMNATGTALAYSTFVGGSGN